MKRALILNAVSPRIGGCCCVGACTAKSTAARALAALLPDIEIIRAAALTVIPIGRISGAMNVSPNSATATTK